MYFIVRSEKFKIYLFFFKIRLDHIVLRLYTKGNLIPTKNRRKNRRTYIKRIKVEDFENFARFAEHTHYHQIQDHEDIIEPIEDVHSYQESSLLSMQFASYMKDALQEDFPESY